MAEAPADRESLSRASARRAGGIRLGPLATGLGATGILVVSHALFELSFGHLRSLPPPSSEFADWTTSLVCEVLIGFMLGARAALGRATLRDLERLRPRLRISKAAYESYLERFRGGGLGRAALASLFAVPVGLLVIPDGVTGAPYLLSDRPWIHGFVWGLLVNAILFAILGRLVYETFEKTRLMSELEEHLEEIDLLDLAPLLLFARRGLRAAFVWLGGSAIASLIFVNLRYHWATGAVIAATLSVGTLAFVLPMRGTHQRIRERKRAELERVRGAIREEREAVLGRDRRVSSDRLPALLAYEARIEGVREWPFDTPTLARFLLLLLLAAGSWLGGALVERFLALFLD